MSKFLKLHPMQPVNLHKKIHEKNKPVRSVFEMDPEQTIAVDLVDMSTQQDQGNRYILNCIDVFSKKVWSYPMKSKTTASLKDAFKLLFREVKPRKLWGDEEAGWKSEEMKRFFANNNVQFYHSYGKHKSMIVERFNRTMKEQMYKSHGENKKMTNWTPFIKKFVPFYNKTTHSSLLKMSPNKVHENKEARDDVRINLFSKFNQVGQKNEKFVLGNWVHIKRKKSTFEKGYTKTFTDEVFKIVHVNKTKPPTYKVTDKKNALIKGTFYERELQLSKEQQDDETPPDIN